MTKTNAVKDLRIMVKGKGKLVYKFGNANLQNHCGKWKEEKRGLLCSPATAYMGLCPEDTLQRYLLSHTYC